MPAWGPPPVRPAHNEGVHCDDETDFRTSKDGAASKPAALLTVELDFNEFLARQSAFLQVGGSVRRRLLLLRGSSKRFRCRAAGEDFKDPAAAQSCFPAGEPDPQPGHAEATSRHWRCQGLCLAAWPECGRHSKS